MQGTWTDVLRADLLDGNEWEDLPDDLFRITGNSLQFVDRAELAQCIAIIDKIIDEEVVEAGETCQLREPQVSYPANLGLENDDIGTENTYFWGVY